MSNTILENAANAIANEFLKQEPVKGSANFIDANDLTATSMSGDFNLLAAARAVFEAIRNPTEEMLEAVHIGDAWNADDPEGIWREMIDAALSQK